jgi:hypothetical protein
MPRLVFAKTSAYRFSAWRCFGRHGGFGGRLRPTRFNASAREGGFIRKAVGSPKPPMVRARTLRRCLTAASPVDHRRLCPNQHAGFWRYRSARHSRCDTPTSRNSFWRPRANVSAPSPRPTSRLLPKCSWNAPQIFCRRDHFTSVAFAVPHPPDLHALRLRRQSRCQRPEPRQIDFFERRRHGGEPRDWLAAPGDGSLRR